MIIENVIQKEQTYKKNDFVILPNPSIKDNFTLALILEDVNQNQKTTKAIILERVKNQIRYFQPIKEKQIKLSKILFKTNKVIMKKLIFQKNEEEVKVYLSDQAYKQIKEKVKKQLKNLKEQQSEDDGEEIEKEQGVELFKRKKIKIQGEKKKGKQKEEVIKYQKGKFNPFVELIEKSEQLEKHSDNPNFDCCFTCNEKEIIRAINTNNYKLIDKIASLCKKSALFITLDPKILNFFSKTALLYCHELGRLKMAEKLIEIQQDEEIDLQPNISYYRYETGRNDKYAYGFELRKVELSRGNKQGNAAFSAQTQSRLFGQYINFEYLIIKDLDQLKNKFKNENILQQLKRKFQNVILFGNVKVAQQLAKMLIDNEGYGMNEFHLLALTAKKPEELNHMKKQNSIKKSIQDFQQISPIHCSVLNPNPGIFEKFLEISQDLFVPDMIQRKLVHFAAASPYPQALRILLDHGIDCRDLDSEKNTPLIYAAQSGQTENIKIMCEKRNYNLDAKNKFNFGAIHYAAIYGHLDSLKELVKQGANVNSTCKKKTYPLMLAVAIGNLEMVKFLLENGAKILLTDAFRRSALIYGIINGHIKVVSYLLQKGANFQGGDSSENSPLHYACGYGFYEMIPLLIKAGANPNVVNNWNCSALIIALNQRHYRCIKILVDQEGVDVNIRENSGKSFLFNFVEEINQKNFEFLKYLFKKQKGNPNLNDFGGNSLLHVLAMSSELIKNSQLKVSLIIDNQIEEEYKEKIKNYEKYFNLMEEIGIDINILNFKFQSPLEIAIKTSNFFFVELALKNKNLQFNINKNQTKTILHTCKTLLLEEKGFLIFEKILDKIKNLKPFLNVFDSKTGYNFLHYLIDQYCLYSKNWDIIMKQYQEQIDYLAQIQNQENQKIENKKNGLNKKIVVLIKKLVKEKSEIIPKLEQNFINIISLLKQRKDMDITIIVEKVINPYEKIYKQKNNQNFNYQTKKPQKKNPMIINNDAGCNLFHILMKNPSIKLLKYFLDIIDKKQFPFNQLNEFKENVLFYFIEGESESVEILQLLLNLKEDPNIPNYKNQTAFLLLCENNKKNLFLNILKSKKIQLERKNNEDLTPLIILSKQRLYEETQELIKQGCNINATDNKGRNALHWAINNNTQLEGNFDFEQLLIDKNININEKDKYGKSPIFYFFTKIGDKMIGSVTDPIECFSDFLINSHIDLNIKDLQQNSILHYAVQRGAFLCITKLLKNKIEINVLNEENNTPFNISLIFGHWNVSLMLLQHNIDVNQNIVVINYYAQKQFKKEQKEINKMELEETEKIQIRKKDFNIEDNQQQNFINNNNKKYFNQTTINQAILNYNKIYNKKNLKQWFEKKFIIEEISSFQYCLKNQQESIQYLILDNGFDLFNAVCEALKQKQFHYAVKLTFKKTSSKGKDNIKFFQQQKQGENLFHFYCKQADQFQNSEIFFNRLINLKVDFNSKDQQNNLPIFYAAQNCNIQLIDKLIEMKSSINVHNEFGDILFFLLKNQIVSLAKQKFETEGLKFICNLENLKYLTETNHNYQSVFEWINKFLSENKLELNNLYRISENEKTLYTLLSYSIIKLRDLNLAKLFLDHGADLNIYHNQSIMMWAIQQNNQILFNFLKKYEKQINFDQVDLLGNTLAHYCVSPYICANFENFEFLKYLQTKIKLNQKNKQGFTPIDLSFFQDSKVIYNFLKQQNLNVSKKLQEIQIVNPFQLVISNQDNINYENDYQKYMEIYKKNNKEEEIKIEVELDQRFFGKIEFLKDENQNPFNITLIKIDIQYGFYSKNVYYRMQIGFDKIKDLYILFTNWGRIGTQGQFQLTPYFKQEDCIKEFQKIFKQKTGNNYSEIMEFEKRKNKYQLVKNQVQYKKIRKTKIQELDEKKKKKSKLPEEIYNFLFKLSKIDIYFKYYNTLQIDQDQMPFGFISLEYVQKAQLLLDDIEKTYKKISQKDKYKRSEIQEFFNEIMEKSQEFYCLIPQVHNTQEPLEEITHSSLQQQKCMIKDLINLHSIEQLLFASYYKYQKINPVDYVLNSLNIKIQKIPQNFDIFLIIQQFIRQYPNIEIDEIFEIHQINKGKFNENSKNRNLLWFQSKKIKILTDLMFGIQSMVNQQNNYQNINSIILSNKFADIYQKNKERDNFIYLIETDLKNCKILKNNKKFKEKYFEKYDSVLSKGYESPNENQNIILKNGCKVEIGELIQNQKYQQNQEIYYIKGNDQTYIRFIIKLKFNKQLF